MSASPPVLSCQCSIAPDHPAFDGHFPGQPLLPGALLLAEVVEALQAAGQGEGLLGFSAAKFLAPVRPGAVLDIRVEAGHATRRFEVRHGAVLVASGVLSWA